jgi:predicted metal-dependent hydrolase
MAKAYKEYITLDNKTIPVNVYLEWRNNARISIGKQGINLRIPKVLGPSQIDKYMTWCEEWTQKQIRKDPKFKARLFRKSYREGDVLEIGEKSYRLNISYEKRKTHSAKLIDDLIVLKINKDDEADHIQSSIRRLLSRVISAEFLPEIEIKVDFINDEFFQEDIKAIRLKYNQSNWGSCSAKRNINLSSRLLFAPSEVINYVIVHELAHLKELNHSNKFWTIVGKVMPDYKKHEKWLKDNGHLCDF